MPYDPLNAPKATAELRELHRRGRESAARDMPTKDTPITVRLPPEMLAQLRASAKELDRPLSWVIRQALERWLKERGS